jgi:hypothetical protein
MSEADFASDCTASTQILFRQLLIVIDKNPIFEMMSIVALSVYRKCEKEDII